MSDNASSRSPRLLFLGGGDIRGHPLQAASSGYHGHSVKRNAFGSPLARQFVLDPMTLASAGPIVSIKGDRAFANSRDVAEFFEKRHDHVLRDIDILIGSDTEAAPNFGECPYKSAKGGRTYRSFDMDQEGFTLLAMGFTGPKALQFKRLYIRAFNAAMEEIQKLRSQAPALPNFANPAEAARAWASEFEQKAIAQQKLVEADCVAQRR